MRLFSALILLLALLSACRNEKKNGPDQPNKGMSGVIDGLDIYVLQTVGDTLNYKAKTLEETEKKGKKKKDEATYIRIQYPVFSRFGNKTVLDSVNRAVERVLRIHWEEEEAYPSIEARMKAFIRAYEESQEELKNFPGPNPQWTCEVNIEVLLNTPNLLSLSLFESNYTGGAHPNSVIHFLNFDLQTGRQILLKDLVLEGKIEQLAPLAERRFREAAQQKGISPEEYSFPNERFYLPENFSIGLQGLRFVYNPYEIGPYALGPLEFELPYSDFVPMINKAVLK